MGARRHHRMRRSGRPARRHHRRRRRRRDRDPARNRRRSRGRDSRAGGRRRLDRDAGRGGASGRRALPDERGMARPLRSEPRMTKPPSKSQRAYHWIKERIANQSYTPGYRLVLGSIAGELDMSVVPVREAIRQLEAEGLVQFEHNIGARVSMVDDAQYRHSMEALSILEGSATALSARHLTADDLKLARAINAQMIETLDHFNPSAFTQLNQQFHAA